MHTYDIKLLIFGYHGYQPVAMVTSHDHFRTIRKYFRNPVTSYEDNINNEVLQLEDLNI